MVVVIVVVVIVVVVYRHELYIGHAVMEDQGV